MSAEENDLRKDLETAFEQHAAQEPEHQEARGSTEDTSEPVRTPEAGQEGSESRPAEGAGEGEQSAEGTSERDEQGRFKPKQPDKPEGAQQANAEPPKQEGQPQQEPLSPPTGWKATAREHWNKLPRQVQEEVTRRERETAQTLRQSAQARQMANDFQNVVNPFLPMIQAQGSNPMQAVKNLMTTAAGLTVGTQQQKAQIVREIIQNYGIDIATLDQVLAGQPISPQAGSGQQSQMAPPPWANPIFQFMNTVQQQRQQREQQIMAEAEAETEAFASKNEFFEDVREEMADLMEVAARRGVVISMKDAYEKAISLNPELSSVVQQRRAASRSQTAQSNIQRNRNAASSITGGPKGGPAGNGGSGDDSRRAAIAEAWENQMGR